MYSNIPDEFSNFSRENSHDKAYCLYYYLVEGLTMQQVAEGLSNHDQASQYVSHVNRGYGFSGQNSGRFSKLKDALGQVVEDELGQPIEPSYDAILAYVLTHPEGYGWISKNRRAKNTNDNHLRDFLLDYYSGEEEFEEKYGSTNSNLSYRGSLNQFEDFDRSRYRFGIFFHWMMRYWVLVLVIVTLGLAWFDSLEWLFIIGIPFAGFKLLSTRVSNIPRLNLNQARYDGVVSSWLKRLISEFTAVDWLVIIVFSYLVFKFYNDGFYNISFFSAVFFYFFLLGLYFIGTRVYKISVEFFRMKIVQNLLIGFVIWLILTFLGFSINPFIVLGVVIAILYKRR